MLPGVISEPSLFLNYISYIEKKNWKKGCMILKVCSFISIRKWNKRPRNEHKLHQASLLNHWGAYGNHDGNGNENITHQKFSWAEIAVHVRYKSL